MSQWFRRSEPPRPSGGGGGPMFSDSSGGGGDAGGGGGGGDGGGGRRGYTDDVPSSFNNNLDGFGGGGGGGDGGSVADDKSSTGGGGRGWFGLGGRAASVPAFMPSEADGDDIPQDDDDDMDEVGDMDDDILRPGDHIYVWRNWTRAYQRHAIVLSVEEEEYEGYNDDGSLSDEDGENGEGGGGGGDDGTEDGWRDVAGAAPTSAIDEPDSPDDDDDVAVDDRGTGVDGPAPTPVPSPARAQSAPMPVVAEDNTLIPGAAAPDAATTPVVAEDDTLVPGAAAPAPVPAAPVVTEDNTLIPGAAAPPPVPSAKTDNDDDFELLDAYSPPPKEAPRSEATQLRPEKSQQPGEEEKKLFEDFPSTPRQQSFRRSNSAASSSRRENQSRLRNRRRSKFRPALGPDGKQDDSKIMVVSFYPLGSKKESGSGPTVDDVREEGVESGESLLGGDNLTGEEDGGDGFAGAGDRRGSDGRGGVGAGLPPGGSGPSSLKSNLVRRETLRSFLEHAAAQDDEDDSFGASRSRRWGSARRKSKADMNKVHKVRYGATLTRRLLSRAGTSLPLPSDPRTLVLARADYLLSRPSTLPPHHPLMANGECAAVWCRTGRWCTAQAAGILQILFVGQAGSAVVAGGLSSQLWVLVPMPGIWGVAGWWWWVPATVAYPFLVPLLVTYGLVSLVPLEILRRYRKKWKGITQALNHGFWSSASDEIREYFGTSEAANEDLLSKFFGPMSDTNRQPGDDGDGDDDVGAGAQYMPVNAAPDGPDDDEDEDEDDMIRRHEEAVAAAYRDEANLSGLPPGQRGLGPGKRRVERILSEWRNRRAKGKSERDIMEMAEAEAGGSNGVVEGALL